MNPAIDRKSPPSLTALIRAIRDCCQRKEEEMSNQLALTASQFACLTVLPDRTQDLSIQEMAGILGLSHSRASRVVDSLVRDGLLARRTMASDRRTQLVALTPKGRRKWQAVHALLEECERKLREQLNLHRPKELEETLKILMSAW